jgi:glycosyltransferase involved in cell wall biosynthesis
MRVVLDAQWLCDYGLTMGISSFTYNLYKTLISCGKNDYVLSFFDKDKERGNREKLKKYFSESEVEFSECNTISYKDVLNDPNVFGNQTYAEATGAYGDVYFCNFHLKIPQKVKEKWVVTVHDFIPMLYKEALSYPLNSYNSQIKAINRIRQWKPHIVTDSECVKQDVLKLIPEYNETEVTVVGLGYNADTHYCEINQTVLDELRIDNDYLLFFSPFDKRKNAPLTVEAFNIIAAKFPNLKLVMSGNFISETQQTMARICRSKYRERIIVTGFVNDDEKRTLMSAALATLYPSVCEGFGLPIIEAQACGCPVITSNTTSMPEVAGDAALLIDPHSVESLANAMEKIVLSKELRNDLVKKGYENIKRYSWSLAAEKMEEVFRKLVTPSF